MSIARIVKTQALLSSEGEFQTMRTLRWGISLEVMSGENMSWFMNI